ncbi:MAG TPA: hypothetical protein VFT04_06290 [Gemmatimonadales bacterium]|nr:hypothetical protein [Gemmatimonadales bacterium]
MTYRHKLSRRLAMLRNSVLAGLTLTAAGCRDNGPLGSTLDPLDSPSEIIALLASSDNPTVAPKQPTPMRVVALTKAGHHQSVEADWMALDGGLLRDSLVGKELVTFFSADEPGEYRLVSFDRGKRFRDTTRVTVPNQGVTITTMIVTPAVAALVAGGSQQFFVHGTTETGDSVPVAAMLQEAPGGVASGLLYTAGDTAGDYTLTFKRQGGPESVQAVVAITVPKAGTPLPAPEDTQPEPTPEPIPAPQEPVPTEPVPTPLPLPGVGESPAEMPRVYLDTRYQAPGGRTIVVPNGGDLQGALNAAVRGDVIELAAGAVFTGNFVLPAKSGAGTIVLRTATSLPAEGVRVTPSQAASYAKIVTANSMPALRTAAGGTAGGYRIMGVELTSSATMSYSIIHIGDYDNTATSVDMLPANVIFDRVYVHGSTTNGIQRCIVLNARASAVVDSWISECHIKGFDSQAIVAWQSPGPLKFVNNHLAGAGENLMIGGADPRIAGLVGSDIEIRRNHFYKPLTWKSSGAWTVKNSFELKNSRRVLVEGNLFENNWSDGQTGFAIVLKSINDGGRCTWCVTEDVTFRYNKIVNSPGGMNIVAVQAYNGGGAIPANSMLIANNVFEDVGDAAAVGDRRIFQLLGQLGSIVIEHNTAFGENATVMFDGAPMSGLVIRNNLLTRGAYGVFGSGKGEGTPALNYFAPGAVFAGNVLIGANPAIYPSGNYFPQSVLTVGMTDYAGGNYTLTSGSTYATSGVGGLTPGADVTRLSELLAGIR